MNSTDHEQRSDDNAYWALYDKYTKLNDKYIRLLIDRKALQAAIRTMEKLKESLHE